jgi:ferritin-like metal-binding protein YciE
MKTLKELFLEQLADMYDAERRVVKALPKLAKAATCPDLQAALLAHLKETQGHVTKLEQVFQSCDQKAKGQTCQATVGLLAEGDEIAAEFKGSPAINAALISAAQKVEHHEMAAYGCLHEWAGLLGNVPAADLIQEILDEEKAANDKLTELARAGNNKEALCDCTENGSKARASDKKPSSLQRGIRPTGTVRKVGKILMR